MEELADRALSLSEPWVIEGAELIDEVGIVEIRVRYDSKRGPCPECGRPCPRHDSVERRWRHLDMWSYQTWIVCRVPRFSCEEHGVRRMDVPWADGWARFTAQFECVVIDWLKVASMNATARNLGLTWDQVNGIQERAVKRGLERREAVAPKRIGVDETSFQKRHEYVTIVTDLDESRVLHVADGRGKDALDGFFEGLSADRLNAIEVVAMDMHQPYIYSAAWHVPGILEKLCFDRFHVAQLLSRAIDQTRRAESKRLASEGDDSLKSTRYLWLRSKSSLPRKLRKQLESLLDSSSSVAEVWAIKEAASKLWTYKSRTWAQKAWVTLCRAARKVDAPALDRAVDTILRHLFGIVNAIVHRVSNAGSESINSRVQALKRQANGYRNRARFRDAILFHLGDLDLYPRQPLPLKCQ